MAGRDNYCQQGFWAEQNPGREGEGRCHGGMTMSWNPKSSRREGRSQGTRGKRLRIWGGKLISLVWDAGPLACKTADFLVTARALLYQWAGPWCVWGYTNLSGLLHPRGRQAPEVSGHCFVFSPSAIPIPPAPLCTLLQVLGGSSAQTTCLAVCLAEGWLSLGSGDPASSSCSFSPRR